MASVKMYYTTLSCSKCGRQLFKAASGSKSIGNPLLICERCKIISRNPMLDEWYNYPHKASVILLPVLMPVLMGIIMPLLTYIMDDSGLDPRLMAIIGVVLGFIVALCLSISNLVAIIKSNKRMKNPEHLVKLMLTNIITEREHKELLEKAQKK